MDYINSSSSSPYLGNQCSNLSLGDKSPSILDDQPSCNGTYVGADEDTVRWSVWRLIHNSATCQSRLLKAGLLLTQRHKGPTTLVSSQTSLGSYDRSNLGFILSPLRICLFPVDLFIYCYCASDFCPTLFSHSMQMNVYTKNSTILKASSFWTQAKWR